MPTTSNKKIKHLFLSLLFDGMGMLSFAVPFLGDFSDVIWAPISAWLMIKLYKGKIGKAAGLVSFVEEIIPGLDVIPTFTIMWLYTYVFKKSKFSKIIDVD